MSPRPFWRWRLFCLALWLSFRTDWRWTLRVVEWCDGHAADVELRLRQVRRALLDAERQLRFAVRDALDARRARVERRRAA